MIMPIIFFVLGLLLGSSIYAFAWRFHEHKDWLKGRSECDYCHHVLSPVDLVPVFSWLVLGGKCRYCHKSLSWQYPLVELATASLFSLSYIFWPFLFHGLGLFQFICWLILLTGFMILVVYDLRWYTLPDKIVFPLTTISFIQLIVVSLMSSDLGHFVEGLIGAIVIAGTFYVLFQLSAGKWIGGGDVKLAICLGLIAGSPLHAVLLIFIASLVGTIIAIPLLLRRRTINIQIPFGPLLILATIIVFFAGSDLISWYSRLIT
jgi:prepilin signal peptidase PulO-like enzyme (type II secretory pathway)